MVTPVTPGVSNCCRVSSFDRLVSILTSGNTEVLGTREIVRDEDECLDGKTQSPRVTGVGDLQIGLGSSKECHQKDGVHRGRVGPTGGVRYHTYGQHTRYIR